MQKLARIIKKRLKTDRDLVVLVTGDEGEGKSRFTLELCKMIDPKFTVERNIAYRGYEIKDKFANLPKYSVLDIDEAMKDFYKRGWMTVDRRKLNILFSSIREKNIVTFLLIPNFWDIDPYYRNHRVRLWIHIATRGVAVVSKKDMNPYSTDKWHQKDNEKLVTRFVGKKGDSVENLLYALKKTKNYVYSCEFIPKDETLWEEYLKKKASYIKEVSEDIVETKRADEKRLAMQQVVIGAFSIQLKKVGVNFSIQEKILDGYGLDMIKSTKHLTVCVKKAIEHQKAFKRRYVDVSAKNMESFVLPLDRTKINNTEEPEVQKQDINSMSPISE